MLHHPAAQSLDLVRRVVFARNEQGRNLEPDLRLVLEINECVEHAGKLAGAEIFVEMLGKPFEIDVGRVHAAEKLAPRLRADVAGTYRYGLDAAFPAGLRDVNRVFKKNNGIIVSKRDRAAASRHRGMRDRLRRGTILHAVERASLRYIPVLAELAGQVAAGRPEGKDRRAGKKMIERLFLDGIDAEAGRATIGREHNLIACAPAHETQPALPLVELAVARADITLEPAVRKRVPIACRQPLDGVLCHRINAPILSCVTIWA